MTIRAILTLIAAITILTACGGGGGGGDSSDTTPNAINLGEETDAALSTQFTDTVTITGIDASTSISITGGEYSLDGGTTYTSANGTVTNNQEVVVRATSAATVSTDVDVVLTVGGVSGTFTITTLDDTTAPTVEIAFPPPASMTEADSVTIRGTASDDLSGIESVTVTLGANELSATDTSDDGSFSTWSLNVTGLFEGENTISVIATDASENSTAGDNIPSVMVKHDPLKDDFPDSNGLFIEPRFVVLDQERNRLLVSDNGVGAILAVNLDSGVRTIFSDNSFENLSSVPNFYSGLHVDSINDRLWLTDSRDDVIYWLDLETGARTEFVVSVDSILEPEGLYYNPRFPYINPYSSGGELLIGADEGVMRVEVATGDLEALTTYNIPDVENLVDSIFSLIFYSESLLALDNGFDQLVSVDPVDGVRTIVSSNIFPNTNEPTFNAPWGMVLDANRGRVIVSNPVDGVLFSVDLDTGERSVFSDTNLPNNFNSVSSPRGMDFQSPYEYFFVADADLDAVLAVDIESGERVFVTLGDSPE